MFAIISAFLMLHIFTESAYGFLNCSDPTNVKSHSVLFGTQGPLGNLKCHDERNLGLYGCAIPILDISDGPWIYVSPRQIKRLRNSELFNQYMNNPRSPLNMLTYCKAFTDYLRDAANSEPAEFENLKRRLMKNRYNSPCKIPRLVREDSHKIYHLTSFEWRYCHGGRLSGNARCVLSDALNLSNPFVQPAYCARMVPESSVFQSNGNKCKFMRLFYDLLDYLDVRKYVENIYECSDYDGEKDELIPGAEAKYDIKKEPDYGPGTGGENYDDLDDVAYYTATGFHREEKRSGKDL